MHPQKIERYTGTRGIAKQTRATYNYNARVLSCVRDECHAQLRPHPIVISSVPSGAMTPSPVCCGAVPQSATAPCTAAPSAGWMFSTLVTACSPVQSMLKRVTRGLSARMLRWILFNCGTGGGSSYSSSST